MDFAARLLALRYAKAFMHCFGNSLNNKDYNALEKTETYLFKNPSITAFFSFPGATAKRDVLVNTFIQACTLNKVFAPLLKLLCTERRMSLLYQIIINIRRLYRQLHDLSEFSAYSATELSDAQKKIVTQMLSQKTDTTVILKTYVDNSLIAGLRLQSEKYLWEDSVEKRLRLVKQEASKGSLWK